MDPRPAPSASVPPTLADDPTPNDAPTSGPPLPPPGGAPPAAAPSGDGWPRPFGPYELLGEVARGGMGVVYKARQRGLDRVVALKMVLGAELGSAVWRFVREAKAAAALDHPNVVAVHDAGEVDGRVYFAMAYVDGPDLAGYIRQRGVPPLDEALHLFVQVVEGVAHAHRAGIIHRDLKPANVLIDRDGRPRVTDFGLAKRAAAGAELTQTGQVMGTPAYMPPEQARDAKEAGPAADVYALGAILYYLLTGRPPFAADSAAALLLKVMFDPPPSPRAANPAVPAEVDALCLRCLAKDPAARFPDADALLDALIPVAEPHLPRRSGSRPWPALRAVSVATPGLPTTLPPGPPEPAPPPARGRRWGWAAGAAAVLGLGAVLLVVRPWARPPGATPGADPASGDPAAAGVSWPPPRPGDFELTLEFVDLTRRDTDGAVLVSYGSLPKIRVRAGQNCYAAVYSLDAEGQVVRLFPNEFDNDGRLTAGQDRLIPPKDEYRLETGLTPDGGTDRLRAFASTQPLPDASSLKVVKGCMVFDTPREREAVAAAARRFASLPRGLSVAGKDQPRVTEAEVPFRVVPKSK